MTALTLVEDLTLIGELALIGSLFVVVALAAWRGIKIIIVHRRENGEK